MGQLSPVLRNAVDGGLTFWCPGCDEAHQVKVGDGAGPRWGWNGNAERPTFTPSVLVTSGHHCRGFQPGDSCWCTFNAEEVARGQPPSRYRCGVCHSFVTDGRIQFLGDCTHELAGQTVDLPAWPVPA
jgi:hypothetical protein